jgi:hypothetical protein
MAARNVHKRRKVVALVGAAHNHLVAGRFRSTRAQSSKDARVAISAEALWLLMWPEMILEMMEMSLALRLAPQLPQVLQEAQLALAK